MNIDADIALTAAGYAADGGRVTLAAVDVGRDPARYFALQEAELQRPVAHGDRILVERICRVANELELVIIGETCDAILAALETDPDDLRKEIVRLSDRREPVAFEKLALPCKKLFEERGILERPRGRFAVARDPAGERSAAPVDRRSVACLGSFVAAADRSTGAYVGHAVCNMRTSPCACAAIELELRCGEVVEGRAEALEGRFGRRRGRQRLPGFSRA